MNLRPIYPIDISRGLLDCLGALAPVNLSLAEAYRLLVDRQLAGIHTLGAFDYNQIVGTTSLFIEQKLIRGGGRVGHVEDVAVLSEYQGRGIGKLLVDYAIAICREAACYKVILNCGDDNVAFYKKLGFHTHESAMRLDLT